MDRSIRTSRNHADYDDLLAVSETLIHSGLDRIYLHLRDARELLRLADHSIAAKATITLACAALESNLGHLSLRAQAFSEIRPNLYTAEQLEYLAAKRTVVSDRGIIQEERLHQSLEERLRIVPDLVARAFHLRYVLPTSGRMILALRKTIELRDRIIHPRWDKYLPNVSRLEAAQAVDAVELYLESILRQLHPYLVGYFSLVFTIRGTDKHDVGVGHRTSDLEVTNSVFVPMIAVGVREVVVQEWMNMALICKFALASGTEGDSEGSLLTRVALVLLFAGLNAQLSITSQWRLHDPTIGFEPVERKFLEENTARLDRDGELELIEDRQSFKKRIVAVPTVLARRVESKAINVNLGNTWGAQLLKSYDLRNTVIHAPADQALPRVTHDELRVAIGAVLLYFRELNNKAPATFKAQGLLLDKFDFC